MNTTMMSSFAVKFIPVYLWLCASLLGCGWALNFSNNSEPEVAHVPSGGSLFPTWIASQTSDEVPAHIRLRRASAYAVTSSCFTPPQPVNGEYKLDRYFCDDIADCEVAEGTALEPGSQLVYRCKPGYQAKGNTDVYCRSRGKWSAIPDCVEVKCDSLNSESTSVTCTRSGKWMNCDSPVPPETRAEVSCRHGYKKDTDFITSRRAVVDCNINGKWEPQPIRCVPVCGLAITHQQPLVHGGTPAKIGDFPWHASLFVEKKSSTGSTKVFLCGGTIIQSNLVLTAAHCVYDERTRTTNDPSKLFVITGNIFRDYDSPVHNDQIVRKAAVKNVYTFCNYYGLTGNYVSDIALLELQKPFEFSSILLPACLDDSGNNDQFLEPGLYGKVAGFGRTETGPTSGILQTLTIPYISYSQCRVSNNAAQNEAFISSDKFCAGYNNGSVVCEGDSGGGLVFKKGDLWYVMGIVSVGLGVDLDNGEKTCDKYSYSLYTKVSAYMAWIKDVLFYLERNQPYPSCSRDKQTSIFTSATTIQTVTTRPAATPSIVTAVTPSTMEGSSCLAPPQPANGEWKLHRNFCEGDTDCSISKGTALKVGSQLVYRCEAQFSVEGSTEVFCRSGGKWSSIPTCNGESCSFADGSSGVCDLLKNCNPVLEMLGVGKSPDKVCGYTGFEPIVCCPMTAPAQDIVGDGRGVIARQKCMEYSRYINTSTCSPSTIDNKKSTSVPSSLGKIKAAPMEFPHMVAVGFEPKGETIKWYCGGTLISKIFVLTAASCTFSPSLGDAAWVRVGELNLERSDDGATPENRRIIERINHPEYKPPSGYHNIALLRLESPVPFNDWIRPACLQTTPSITEKEAVATGWGLLDFAGESSPDLMKVRLPLIDLETCKTSWDSNSAKRKLVNGIVGDLLICAGDKGRDTCQGDSGGPLTVRRAGIDKELCTYDVIGITSIGRACGTGVPALYTRVYNYVPWIESIVWGRE